MTAAATASAGRDKPCPEPHRPAPAWPQRVCFLDLSALITAPMCARAWTREILREWQAPDLADSAELIVTELATNALEHTLAGPGQPVIRLALAFDHGALVILVGDGNPDLPAATHPGADAESGRGLEIVEFISDVWGVYLLDDGAGKAVWVVLALEPGTAVGAHAAPEAIASEMMARPMPEPLPSADAQPLPCPGAHEDLVSALQAARL